MVGGRRRAVGPVANSRLAILSPREHEFVLLAAAGQSNKEIAAQLWLSPRTVENTLSRAYLKLGVRGRPELAAIVAGARRSSGGDDRHG